MFMKEDNLNCIFTVLDNNGIINIPELERIYKCLLVESSDIFKITLINKKFLGEIENYIELSEAEKQYSYIITFVNDNNEIDIPELKNLYNDFMEDIPSNRKVVLKTDKLNGFSNYIKAKQLNFFC